MSMSKQVNNIVKSCYFHIRNIARIRKYLSFKSCEILVQAFVISRLDYCNSLLHALPNCDGAARTLHVCLVAPPL